MGIELARAYVRIQGDTSGLSRDLSNTQTEVDSAMKSIAAGASSIMLSFASFGKGIISQGMEAAGQFEKTTIEMETLIGNAKETQVMLADLTQFAVKTPFEMPGILQVSTGLLQFGERGKELMSTLQMLGDASSGDSQKFQMLGLVFNQIRGVGKLLTQDFRQLSTRGIISLQDIAKYYGKTTTEAEKMLSSGKIGFNDFRKILASLTGEGGRFYNMMQKQSTSLTGLTSTLSDARNIAIRTLAVPLVPMYKAFLTVMIELTNQVEIFVRNGGEMVSFALVGATAFAMLGGAIMGAAFAARLLGVSIRSAIMGTGIGIFIIALGAGLGVLVSWLMQSVYLQELFAEGWKAVYAFGTQAWQQISSFISRNAGEFQYIGELITEIFNNLVDTVIYFAEVAWSYISWFTAGAAANIGSWSQWTITSIWKILEVVAIFTNNWSLSWQWVQVQAMLVMLKIANAVMNLFNMLVGTVVGAGMAMYTTMLNVAHNIGVAFEMIVGVIRGLFMGLWELIKKGGAWDKGEFLTGFSQAFEKELLKIKGEFKPLGEGASKAFSAGLSSWTGDKNPLGKQIKALGAAGKALWSQMEKDRQQELDLDAAYTQAMAKRPEKEIAAAKQKEAMKNAQFDLKEGRYSFADLGTKLQEGLLGKGKDSIGQKQLSVAEQGLKKQDELIKATQSIQGGLGA